MAVLASCEASELSVFEKNYKAQNLKLKILITPELAFTLSHY